MHSRSARNPTTGYSNSASAAGRNSDPACGAMIGTGMTEPFFFNRGRGLSVREIAALTGAKPRPGSDLDRRITGIAALDQAAPSDLAFLEKAKYVAQLSTSGAGACLTTERYAGRAPAHVSVLCVAEPYRAFVEVTRALFGARSLRGVGVCVVAAGAASPLVSLVLRRGRVSGARPRPARGARGGPRDPGGRAPGTRRADRPAGHPQSGPRPSRPQSPG